MQTGIADVPRENLVQALRHSGSRTCEQIPLHRSRSSWRSRTRRRRRRGDSRRARAEAIAAPAANRRARPQPVQRSAPPRSAHNRGAASTPERVPAELRKDINSASAEDIARMLGSKKPVIQPASDEPETAPTPISISALERHTSSRRRVARSISTRSSTRSCGRWRKQNAQKFDALLNGSCRAMSFEDGVLTLGSHGRVSQEEGGTASDRKHYEQMASQLLGEPVTIRCIIAQRPPRAMKSPLVQHAVQTHGAKIVAGEEEK